MAILEIKDLHVKYGMIEAIKGVSFEVNEGEIVALIGANGAGKTTIMHSINGLIPRASGEIIYNGQELGKIPSHKIVTLGLTQVPERRRVFTELTVKDNLLLGAYTRNSKEEKENTLAYIYDMFPILKERSNQEAGTLSGGEQQMLAVGRALMSHPKVLLLDEPSMGLSPLYVDVIFSCIKKLNEQGTTILLVEQNAKKALSIANRAYVIETGKIKLEGQASKLLNDPKVQKAYLGA